jgi:hypothetical protein
VVLSVKEEPVEISPLEDAGRKEWQDFLARSDNGCLFHDLDFLDYHPPGRFRFHHLVARQKGKVLALIPGGLIGDRERPVFSSPVGASVGGPVIDSRMRTAQGIALVTSLQAHAAKHAWAGLKITLAPAIYNVRTQDLVAFSLFCRGFKLEHRWNCYVVPVRNTKEERFSDVFRERQATWTRAARRAGVTASEGGAEMIGDFLLLYRDTYQRHGAEPTHSDEELADLLRRFPRRISLVIAKKGDLPVAGLLVMRMNPRVAYTFYICSSTAHAEERGNLVAFAALLDILGTQKIQWMDAGPGAWDGNFNDGVVFFKEGIGAAGHCRDQWSWNAPPA